MKSPPLILGTAQLAGDYGVARPREAGGAESRRVLLGVAQAVGISAIDTAPAYGPTEQVIGEAALALPIHTKVDRRLSVGASLARSLIHLRRSEVEVLYLHDPSVLADQPQTVRELRAVVGSGAQQAGVSVYELAEFDAAVHDGGLDVVQVPVNLLDRRFTGETLRVAAEKGVLVYARSVFLQGALTAPIETVSRRAPKLVPAVRRFEALALDMGKPREELALRWACSHPGIAGVLVGVDSTEQLRSLARMASHGPLNEDDMQRLASLGVPPWPVTDPRTWT